MKNKKPIILNITLLIVLVFFVLKENYHKKVFSLIKPQKDNYNITSEYKHETEIYKYYKKKGNIVMLGNSITYRVNWNELLNRNDIINRGIGKDITEGMLNRLESVINVNPKICFVMGGINDINKGITPIEIVSNLKAITDKLNNNNIKPIIFSILYVADTFNNYKDINALITTTNSLIERFCLENDINFININSSLSSNETLKNEYSFDGIHLTALGYSKWKEVITPIIEQEIKQKDINMSNK